MNGVKEYRIKKDRIVFIRDGKEKAITLSRLASMSIREIAATVSKSYMYVYLLVRRHKFITKAERNRKVSA